PRVLRKQPIRRRRVRRHGARLPDTRPMKLYGSLTSPYVRKIRALIAEKGIDCPFEVIDPHAPDSPVPQYNPLGLVPALARDYVPVLFDSPVIAEYLDSLRAPALIPPAGEARWQVLRIAALA